MSKVLTVPTNSTGEGTGSKSMLFFVAFLLTLVS